MELDRNGEPLHGDDVYADLSSLGQVKVGDSPLFHFSRLTTYHEDSCLQGLAYFHQEDKLFAAVEKVKLNTEELRNYDNKLFSIRVLCGLGSSCHLIITFFPSTHRVLLRSPLTTASSCSSSEERCACCWRTWVA